MSEQDQTARSLVSLDAATWHYNEGNGPITKAVIGKEPPKKDSDDDTLELQGEVLADLAGAHWNTLTHLHLWSIANVGDLLTQVEGKWPTNLKCLDLRGCRGFSKLSDLPKTLEELDLGWCGELVSLCPAQLPNLRRLYLDGCRNVKEIKIRLLLENAISLEEFSCVDCTQITAIADLPEQLAPSDPETMPVFPEKHLKKLNLKGCRSLVSLPDLSGYRWLHHLNLTGCEALREFPKIYADPGTDEEQLPPGIRYLVNHNCRNLMRFGELDVRKVHCSPGEDRNVASIFRTMQRLQRDPDDLIMAKVLILGSGRCGKTTLAKALQWKGMSESERQENRKKSDQREHLDPAERQLSTHGIHFWQWKTEFDLPESEAREGLVHLWDFAGQEIYHNTHRLFASEGSVFFIVTTDPMTHQQRVDEELVGITDEVKRKKVRRDNEYRELKYWLDYIRRVLKLDSLDDFKFAAKKVSVRVIFTGTRSEDNAITVLKQQAGMYAPLLESGDIQVTPIDFHDSQWESAFGRVASWTKAEIGKAADRFGTRVPGLFSKVADYCAGEQKTAGKRYLSEKEWEHEVEKRGPITEEGNVKRSLKSEQANATADFLHQCGRVFRIRGGAAERSVILNQQWGADLIYYLANDSAASEIQKYSSSWMDDEAFRKIIRDEFALFSEQDAGRKRLFFDLIDQCDVVKKVGQKWVAIQKEFLPDKTSDLESELESLWSEARFGEGTPTNFTEALHGDQDSLLGNSDYADLLVFVVTRLENEELARLLFADEKGDDHERWQYQQKDGKPRYRSEVRFWKNGFFVFLEKTENSEKLALQVEWKPCFSPETLRPTFEGGLFIQFLSPNEELFAPRLKELFETGNGPLAIFEGKFARTDQRPDDLSKEAIGCRKGFGQLGWRHPHGPDRPNLRHDVAISYRSSQKDVAADLVFALREAGVSHWYEYSADEMQSLKESRGESEITEIYDYLKYAKVLIVIASPEYFEASDYESKKNLYCPVELAEAVLAACEYSSEERKRFGGLEERRSPERFLWVSAGDPSPSANDLEKFVPKLLDDYFDNISRKRAPSGMRTKGLTEITKREYRSMEDCDEGKITEFLNHAGRNTKQLIRRDPRNEKWATDLTTRIRKILEGS